MKAIIICLAISTFINIQASAQEIKNTDTTQLNAIVVSGSKYEEKQKNIVQKIDIISAKQIATTNAPSTGDLLMQSGQVFVQKSQLGGSSPVIRGFEANRVLMVIDGVRMNNAVYRGGHLQNVITIDQSMLDNIEILNGPASTLFGSDALGGVMNFTTKKIQFNTNNGNAFVRYSSACNEVTAHADVNIANQKFGSLTSITHSNFNSLRSGANRNSVWGNVGLRSVYADRIADKDTMLTNSNPQLQLGTAYRQIDVLQKFSLIQNKNIMHHVNLQFSTSSDVPRYDRLTNIASGKPQFAEWYYGPQTRYLASYNVSARNFSGFFTDANFNINYQNISEDRINRKFGNDNRTRNEETINVIGFDANARRKGNINELIIGVDGQYNNVKSIGKNENIKTSIISIANSRYPDAGSTYQMYGAYIQNITKLSDAHLVFNSGLRTNQIALASAFTNNTPTKFPYNTIKQNNRGVTGNLGVAYLPTENFRITAGFSTGFKAPNVDETAKVFETGTKAGYVVVPNENLKPEYAHNIDFGFSYQQTNKVMISATVFYTALTNAIVTDNFKFNGNDSILYDGKTLPTISLTNNALAQIYGISASAKMNILSNLIANASINYTAGRYDAVGTFASTSNNTVVPMDHIPPVFGRVGLQYNYKKISTECWTLFNGKKALKDYNPLPASEDNIGYAIAGYGTPAWATLNIRGSYVFNKNFTLQAGLENIFDTHYRHFASGISAPGINAIVAIRVKL